MSVESPLYVLRGFCDVLDLSKRKDPDKMEQWLKGVMDWWPNDEVSRMLQKSWVRTSDERLRLLHLRNGLCSYITLWVPEEAWLIKGKGAHSVLSRSFWVLFYRLMHYWLERGAKVKKVKAYIKSTFDLLALSDDKHILALYYVARPGLDKSILLEESRDCITKYLWCWAVFKGVFQYHGWSQPQLFQSD